MADTDDDVTRLGEMMTDTGWQPMTPDTPRVIARYLLNQGVTCAAKVQDADRG